MLLSPSKIALIIVDVQNDFLPNGALAVLDAEKIIVPINQLMDEVDFVIATQDFHPQGHVSFASTHYQPIGSQINGQMLWPDHCVQGTKGSNLSSDLDLEKIDAIIQKGTDQNIDSYSGFFDNARKQKTKLDDTLKEKGITQLVVTGLATDYCVKFTALDALELGFEVFLDLTAMAAVNLHPSDGEKAIQEMQEKGAKILNQKILK